MDCLDVGCADGIGDGQHLFPFVTPGDEVVAVGVILFTGSLRVGALRVFVSFRIVWEGGVGEGLNAR